MSKENNNQIITFGCRLNAFESQAIKQAIDASTQKNLIVFNSCAVTAKAEKDVISSVKKARKNNPNAKIVLTGCLAQINPQKFAQMPEIDLVLGNSEKSLSQSYDFSKKNFDPENNVNNKIDSLNSLNNNKDSSQDSTTNIVNSNKTNINLHQDQIFKTEITKQNGFFEEKNSQKIKVNDIMSIKDTAPQLVSYFDDQTRAFLEIQNGCNHRCTFCIIPYGRGNSRSVPLGVIVDQAKKMLDNGHKEIVLTGVDISDYGKDLPSPINLAQMIKRLLKMLPNLERLRLSSIDVAELDDEFLEVLKSEERLMPYLHLSVQSGDDLILKRMKRRHTSQQLIDFCQKARLARPNITFGADLIAGFPSEDQQMFDNSLKIIEQADLIFTHIFPFSPRLGTPAYKMKQLDKKTIKNRAKILREKGQQQLTKFLQQQIGKTFEVLVEKNNLGKTKNFLNVRIVDNIDSRSGNYSTFSSLAENSKIINTQIINSKTPNIKNNNYQQNSTFIHENTEVLAKVIDYNEKELIAVKC
ncbi:MAG: hypothetical protein RL769_43 [Pseudomonadota bacterium]|jgi:threonylcarbamoyladenosine tRNA methylthiotransferase MtaB